MKDEEREALIAAMERLLLAGASPGYLRLSSLLNKVDKPAAVDKALLDPTSTFKE